MFFLDMFLILILCFIKELMKLFVFIILLITFICEYTSPGNQSDFNLITYITLERTYNLQSLISSSFIYWVYNVQFYKICHIGAFISCLKKSFQKKLN